MTPAEIAAREIACPRCHEECGWCGDYRHMHGLLHLPGYPKHRCDIPAMAPDAVCPMCHGSKRVIAETRYSPAAHLIGGAPHG